ITGAFGIPTTVAIRGGKAIIFQSRSSTTSAWTAPILITCSAGCRTTACGWAIRNTQEESPTGAGKIFLEETASGYFLIRPMQITFTLNRKAVLLGESIGSR